MTPLPHSVQKQLTSQLELLKAELDLGLMILGESTNTESAQHDDNAL